MVLAPSLDVGVVGEVGSVNARLGVRGNRVRYQISQTSVYDEDGSVWS